jgi:DNA repair ATPase RecN
MKRSNKAAKPVFLTRLLCVDIYLLGMNVCINTLDKRNTVRLATMRLGDATMRLSEATMRLSEATMRLSEATMRLSKATMRLSEATMRLSAATMRLSEVTMRFSYVKMTMQTPARQWAECFC